MSACLRKLIVDAYGRSLRPKVAPSVFISSTLGAYAAWSALSASAVPPALVNPAESTAAWADSLVTLASPALVDQITYCLQQSGWESASHRNPPTCCWVALVGTTAKVLGAERLADDSARAGRLGMAQSMRSPRDPSPVDNEPTMAKSCAHAVFTASA